MIGLEIEGRPLTRAYSIAGANYDDYLEFLGIKVQDGPLTSRLQHIPRRRPDPGRAEAHRHARHRQPQAGRNLFLLGTGAGLAPFMSLIRDPEIYERFEKIVLVHRCRRVSELAYGDRIMHELPQDEYLGEAIRSSSTARQ